MGHRSLETQGFPTGFALPSSTGKLPFPLQGLSTHWVFYEKPSMSLAKLHAFASHPTPFQP